MKQRFTDLANTCYQRGHYTFTHFLTPAQIDEFFQIQSELSFVGYALEGGSEMAERQMLRFGDEEMFGRVSHLLYPLSSTHTQICREAGTPGRAGGAYESGDREGCDR